MVKNTKTKLPKQSKTKQFIEVIKKHKLISLFFFSLLGGIPGAINIWSWINNKPSFKFRIDSITSGHTQNREGPLVFLLLHGAIQNDGKQPLFPHDFFLELQFQDTLISILATPWIFDSTMTIESKSGYKLKIKNPNDLLKIKKVEPNDVVYGLLLFPTRINERDIFTFIKAKLICYDINNKKYEQEISKENMANTNRYIFPRDNIERIPN